MNDVITALNWVNDAVFVSLVNTILQITLLIPLIALIIWMFRIKSATTRYSLWLFALFAMLALPLLTPFIPQIDLTRFHHQRGAGYGPTMSLGMGASNVGEGELSEVSGSMPPRSMAEGALDEGIDVSLINPVSIAYFIWCAGALFMLCITIGVYGKLRKLRLDSSDMESQVALEVLSRLRDKLGIRRTVALKVSSEIYIPMSMGILSPVIIVPDSVIDNSASDQLEMILAHELAHIKRCDYLIRILQNVLKVVFFFHPLFHLMKRNLAREREHICDDWVINVTKQRSGYAECIIGLLEKALYKPVNVPATVAMTERKRDIPGRIDMIVDRKRKITTKVSRKALIAVFLIGCIALPIIGGIGLVRFARARPASDEGWIVFGRGDQGIWVMDADGKNEKQLTTRGGGGMAWSPHGRQIAFGAYMGARVGDIYMMNADGSNIRRLTDFPAYDYWPTWSPDGKQIAFTREIWEKKDGKWKIKSCAIYVMDADGANVNRLTESPPLFDRNPDWSPDGRKIAFYLWGLEKVRNQVWVMDADGGNRKVLNDWGRGPDWSPDGKRIAFTSGRDSWKAWKSNDIYVMDADGANVKRLTAPGPAWQEEPKWSPDGTKITFYSNRDGNWEIYVINADGSDVQRLTNTPENEFAPDWTAFSYAVEPAGKLRSTWGKIKRGLFSH